MIRKNLCKCLLAVTIAATFMTVGCGKKAGNTQQDYALTETQSAVNNKINTGIVTFEYTDEDGKTYSLDGKAVVNDEGIATIEVVDAYGNKVVFEGESFIDDDNVLKVKNIAVKNTGILLKEDGTEIKVNEESSVSEAKEKDSENDSSDIVASKEAKKEVELAKKEEQAKSEANEEIDKINDEKNGQTEDNDNSYEKENGLQNTVSKEEPKEDKSDDNVTSDSNDDEKSNDEPLNPPIEDNKPDNEESNDSKKEEDSNPAPTPAPDPKPEFETVDGPNGPMYAYKTNGHRRGEDVNQGSNMECPYPLKTITTRYAPVTSEFGYYEGYYYIAVDEDGLENEGTFGAFKDLSYVLGRYNCTCTKVGTFSCGDVWYCSFED